MEFLIGSAFTLIMFVMVRRSVEKHAKQNKVKGLMFSQSYRDKLFYQNIPNFGQEPKKKLVTQATKHTESVSTRIIMMDNIAYWIEESGVVFAKITEEGINQEDKKPLDTMGMDDVELKKIMFIVEKLTEGLSDDRSYNG